MLSFAPSITKLANNAYGNNISIAPSSTPQLGNREAMSSIAPVAQ